jgi:lipid-A-disaccharide synthase
MEIDYVGNPLLMLLMPLSPMLIFSQIIILTDKKIVALLPGSRKQEISRLLPEMLGYRRSFPSSVCGCRCAIVQCSILPAIPGQKAIPVIFNATYDILANAEAAVVASGTATLETALFNVPQVVVYKGNAITIGIARMLIKIKFISLVNLIMDREVVKELIQQDCTSRQNKCRTGQAVA